jgi:predicted aspartyl protease
MPKKYFNAIILILGVVLLGEIYYGYKVHSARVNGQALEIKKIEAQNAIQMKELQDEFASNLYQATGSNPYERVYNRQNQSIEELIQNLASAAIPEKWKAEVHVEEFTNFILLLQPPIDEEMPDANRVASYLIPILKYSSPYLKNVAVYTKNHMCYLYYDEVVISQLITQNELSQNDIAQIWDYGRNFTHYNAIKISYEKQHEHMYIPVTIAGNDGIKTELLLFDTGASTTIIPLKTALITQSEDLNKARWETFNTANGMLRCPITRRVVSIGGIEKNLNVAVFLEEDQEQGLLGVDFFSGLQYTVDSQTNALYVWETRV